MAIWWIILIDGSPADIICSDFQEVLKKKLSHLRRIEKQKGDKK